MNDFKCLHVYVCIYRVVFMFLKLYMKGDLTVHNLRGLVFFSLMFLRCICVTCFSKLLIFNAI